VWWSILEKQNSSHQIKESDLKVIVHLKIITLFPCKTFVHLQRSLHEGEWVNDDRIFIFGWTTNPLTASIKLRNWNWNQTIPSHVCISLLTDPKIVNTTHKLAVGLRNLLVYILVKTWLYAKKLRQRGEVVCSICQAKKEIIIIIFFNNNDNKGPKSR